MSLADAVLEIANEMEREAGPESGPASDDYSDTVHLIERKILHRYVRELRRMILAHKPDTSPTVENDDPLLARCDAATQAKVRAQRERAKKRLAEEQRQVDERLAGLVREDEHEAASMRECDDGPFAGFFVPLPPRAPVGSFFPALESWHVYELRADGRLYYSKEQTTRYRGTLGLKDPLIDLT